MMKSIRWLLSVVMFGVVACGGNEKEFNLPETHVIAKGGNLYEATAALCGTNAADEQGRGRWRRWRESDDRIARAPMRNDKKLGAVITIPPGTYLVPRDLCADEAGFPWWSGWLVIALILLVVAAMARYRAPTIYPGVGPRSTHR